MTIDGKKIMEKLRAEKADKGPVTLYLPKALYSEFQRRCGDIAASTVIEQLIIEFLETAPEPSGKPARTARK